MEKGSEISDVEKGSEISDVEKGCDTTNSQYNISYFLLNSPWPLTSCALCLSPSLLLGCFRAKICALEY